MSAVSGESLRRPRGRPPSSTDLHFPFLEQRLQGGVGGGFEFLLVEKRIPDGAVLLTQQGPGFPDLRALRALDREDLLAHLDDLRVDLVGFGSRGEERFVFLIPVVDQGGDLMDDVDGLLVDRARLLAERDGRLVLLLRGLKELRDPRVDVLDLFRNLVLVRLEGLELLEAFHRSLEFDEQLVFRAQRQGGGLLPHLHLGYAPLQGAQLRADISGTRAAELPLHLDQGLRLRLEIVPLLPVLEGAELRTDLPLLLVDEIPLLPEELRLLVQGVALLEETLELDLRLIEFRKSFLPDHRVPHGKMECSD